MNFKSLSLTVLFVLSFQSSLAAQEKAFDPKVVKAYALLPLSPFEGTTHAFLQLKANQKVIATIPFNSIKEAGLFSTSFRGDGRMELSFKTSPTAAPLVIARQKSVDGWYPPTEFCTSPDLPVKCQYFVSRDDSNQSISIKVLRKN